MNRRTKIIRIVIIIALSINFSVPPGYTLGGKTNLSPPISLNLSLFGNSYTLAAICNSIEQNVDIGDKQVIRNIHSWISKNSKIGVSVYSQNNEVILEVPEEKMAIRYFVPGKVPVVTPFTDITRLKTKTLNKRLCRQIIYRVKGLENEGLSGKDILESHTSTEYHSTKTSGFTEEDLKHVNRLYDFTIKSIQTGELDADLPVVASIVDGEGKIVNTVTRQKYDSDHIEMLKEKLDVNSVAINNDGNLIIKKQGKKNITLRKNNQQFHTKDGALEKIENKYYWVSYKNGKFKFKTRYGVGARHAEMHAIKQAEKAGFTGWKDATMYVNLSSCHNCNKAISEFYGFKKVVYISLDTSLKAVENERNSMVCKRNNVAQVACPENDLVRKNKLLFKQLYAKKSEQERSSLMQTVLSRAYKYVSEFRDIYRHVFGDDVQVIGFNADLWSRNTKEKSLIRNIEWVLQNRNPNKPLVLLLLGNRKNCTEAKRIIIKEKIFHETSGDVMDKIIFYNDLVEASSDIFSKEDMPEKLMPSAKLLVEYINETGQYEKVEKIREKLEELKQIEKLYEFEELLYQTNSLSKGEGWKPVKELDDKILVNEKLGYIDYSSDEPVIEADFDLIAARHGKTFGNDWKVLQGQQDITDGSNTGLNQLNDNGQEQAKVSAEALWETLGPRILKGEDVVVVTSDLSRSKQTAQYFIDKVKEKTGIELSSVEEKDATEISFGVCGNTPYVEPTEEIRQKLKAAGISAEAMSPENEKIRQTWLGGNSVIKFEKGESFVDVLIRTKRLIEKLNREYKGKTVVMVGHGTQLTAMRILLRKDVITNIDQEGNVYLMWRNKHPVKGKVELDNSEIEQLAFGAAGAEREQLSEKCVFGNKRIMSPKELLSQMENFPFPGREYQRESLKYVIEKKRPHEDYYLMKLDPEKYTKEVRDMHYKIAMAGWRGSKVVLEQVLPVDTMVELFSEENNSFRKDVDLKRYYSTNGEIQTREKIIELDLVNKYIKEKGRKNAKFEMMNSVWTKAGAIKLLPRSLLDHAMDEWEIITKLLINDPTFKGVLGIPCKEVAPIMRLYREFFGVEFKGIAENVQTMNFMSQFLLLHDIGKYIEGDKGHEQRSEKLLEEIFKSDYFGFNEAEKHLIRALSGIHAEIEDLNRDKSMMGKVEKVMNEAISSGVFKENELLDILRVFTVFRIAEQLQAADFGFAERSDFEVWRDMYDTIKSIIHKEFLKGTKRNTKEHNYSQYLNANEEALSRVFADSKQAVLLRVPLEILEQINEDNVRAFLEAFSSFPNTFVRLFYMSGIDEDVNAAIYAKYSIEKKELPETFSMSRESTITLLPVLKEDTITDMTIISRLGTSNIKATDTILSPVGLLNDSSGFVRATIFGLRIMALTRDISKNDLSDLRKDTAFMGTLQRDVFEVYKQICDPEYQDDLAGLNLEDIIGLAIGDINEVVVALKKLVKLIPISPIDPEELRLIFENARKILLAA